MEHLVLERAHHADTVRGMCPGSLLGLFHMPWKLSCAQHLPLTACGHTTGLGLRDVGLTPFRV